MAEIRDGLDSCSAELEDTIELFSINSTIVLHTVQRDIDRNAASRHAEMLDRFDEILDQLRRGNLDGELPDVETKYAAQLMAAGQEGLRMLRETSVLNGHAIPSSESARQPCRSQLYLEYQRGLISLHRKTGIPPTIKNLNGEIAKVSDLAVAGGMYSDIWIGQWLGEEKVALKALRDVKASDPRATARFEKEVRIWSELQNDHILPFYGIVTDLGWHIYMVSPWQENGNVLEYTKINGDSYCMRLIYGAAQGLEYLHSNGIIHGNVKCANILVSEGEARLCDFGMSKVIEDVTERSVSATLSAGDNARWTAPELILEGKGPSTEADTYSFAMAILELLTKKRPYAECRSTPTVIYRFVAENKPPSRPIEH